MAVRFTGPVLNKEKQDGARGIYSNLPVSESMDHAVYFNDFLSEKDYAASDWTITTTEAGAGSATEALVADEVNGALKILNDDASADSDSLQLVKANFKLSAGKRVWFEAKVKISSATLMDALISLNILDTTPLTTTEFVGFRVANGSGSILCKTGLSSETSTASGLSMVADTYRQLGFVWDGKSKVDFYVDRGLVATHTTNLPTDVLSPTLSIKNGSAVAQSMTVDYLYVCQER